MFLLVIVAHSDRDLQILNKLTPRVYRDVQKNGHPFPRYQAVVDAMRRKIVGPSGASIRGSELANIVVGEGTINGDRCWILEVEQEVRPEVPREEESADDTTIQ